MAVCVIKVQSSVI